MSQQKRRFDLPTVEELRDEEDFLNKGWDDFAHALSLPLGPQSTSHPTQLVLDRRENKPDDQPALTLADIIGSTMAISEMQVAAVLKQVSQPTSSHHCIDWLTGDGAPDHPGTTRVGRKGSRVWGIESIQHLPQHRWRNSPCCFRSTPPTGQNIHRKLEFRLRGTGPPGQPYADKSSATAWSDAE
ncbi:uncharacterized protein LY89DRAFT_670719 [Mollisia scopiformis]|uniref:Uncharacterized protein n=1 Tax=Mollisia scopiformis TaxID=149040 RepID=A0A194X578_MOLSC|nr:uncharacterized protein LY89DRAFT_670719 [Mollisia scopiformis]KUJ15219.1 hypothetical protein LY89DRAFT_670719 [Mollisia scopiformis]